MMIDAADADADADADAFVIAIYLLLIFNFYFDFDVYQFCRIEFYETIKLYLSDDKCDCQYTPSVRCASSKCVQHQLRIDVYHLFCSCFLSIISTKRYLLCHLDFNTLKTKRTPLAIGHQADALSSLLL